MKSNNNTMKQTILLEASNLITKNGIKNTSLADIARTVGISKGTLYYHYASKDELIGDIADIHLNMITDAVLSCVQNVNFDNSKDMIINSIMEKISAIEGTGRIHMYLICEAITGNDTLKERIRIKYIEWRKTLKSEIQSTVKDDKSADALSFLLLSIVDGLVVQGLLKSEKVPYENIADFLVTHWH